MRTETMVEALDGLNLGELTEVATAMLQRLTAAAGSTTAAGDHTLGGLLHGVVDSLGEVPIDGVISDTALTDSVVALQRAEARVTGEKLRRIAELAARKAHRGKAMSTGDWLGPQTGPVTRRGTRPDRDRPGAATTAKDRPAAAPRRAGRGPGPPGRPRPDRP